MPTIIQPCKSTLNPNAQTFIPRKSNNIWQPVTPADVSLMAKLDAARQIALDAIWREYVNETIRPYNELSVFATPSAISSDEEYEEDEILFLIPIFFIKRKENHKIMDPGPDMSTRINHSPENETKYLTTLHSVYDKSLLMETQIQTQDTKKTLIKSILNCFNHR